MSDPADLTIATLSTAPDAALKEALLRLLRQKSVLFGDFTLASGAKSDFYVDCRITTMDARGAWLIGLLGARIIEETAWITGQRPVSVGGLTMGADPVALAIALASSFTGSATPLHAFSVRKAAKSHGRGKLIEGNFAAGQDVVVVDDVITTGGSTLQAIDSIQAEGGRVVMALAVVDREEGGRAAIEARGIPVRALATKSELRQVDA